MIRRGKVEGWLHLPVSSLRQWAVMYGITLHGVEVQELDKRGSALILVDREFRHNDGSSRSKQPAEEMSLEPPDALIIVPRDMILSKENVEVYAKADSHLRDVLESVGEFAKTPRGAILSFLLVQATRSCPNIPEAFGLATPFTDYMKFLPLELLPTFWTDDELELLDGTSLAPAMQSKMKSLHREFEHFRYATSAIPWCKNYWWDEETGVLTFDDWKQVDAMYRSRALEFPGMGDSMVPCIDMANHASRGKTISHYDIDRNGNAVLLLRKGSDLKAGTEVTITYGDEKGACEMLFSYGFLEDGITSARDIFLDLEIPDDDPLKRAKKAVSTCAPGMRIADGPDGVQWESEFVWIICINEEDGLQFQVARTLDGDQELHVIWKAQDVEDTTNLEALLKADRSWDIYHLRVVSIIQSRVEQQLEILHRSSAAQTSYARSTSIRERPWQLAMKLRQLERNLLQDAYSALDEEKLRLANTDTVREYLARVAEADTMEDDFS